MKKVVSGGPADRTALREPSRSFGYKGHHYPLSRSRTNRAIPAGRDWTTARIRAVTHARDRRLNGTNNHYSRTSQNIPRDMTQRSITTRLETCVRAIRVPSVCPSSTWLPCLCFSANRRATSLQNRSITRQSPSPRTAREISSCTLLQAIGACNRQRMYSRSRRLARGSAASDSSVGHRPTRQSSNPN
jgi:hypothetical protein